MQHALEFLQDWQGWSPGIVNHVNGILSTSLIGMRIWALFCGVVGKMSSAMRAK
jgi:hypothetical protein